MIEFKDLLALAVNRKGGLKPVEAQLPAVKSAAQLRRPDDAFYFSALTRRVFRAGLKHSLVDAKWPAFEEAFFGFDPDKLVLMPDSMLEERMQDTRLIRHWGKIKAIRHNAQLVLDLRREYGSMGRWLADWPAETLFVVYCAGPHCNGANRAAVRLAGLGRPVKEMIGGVTGWLDEGFELSRD